MRRKFNKSEASSNIREGIIVILPKPNKPRDLLKSYRPITLLNVCYKIISATIANRLKIVLQKMIDPCQSAYLKGRFIGDNIRMVYDVVQRMKQDDTSGILLNLDIESAFDSVSWAFIKSVMKARNFPPYIISWFETLYADSFSRVLYNGHLSSKIKLERSCRQGDALSCYLFILVMDVLAKRINSNKEINGIKIGQEEHKVLMYADDTVCLVEPKERCITELFQELGWFAKFSGLKPNLDKTQAMWIGSSLGDATRFERNFNLQWVRELKILGVAFENSLSSMTEIYKEKVCQMKSERAQWMNRNISLPGKVTIIKSLLVSKISYLFLTIPNPNEEVLKELNKTFYSFLWHGKGEKIKRNTLIKDPVNGGIGMLDVISYMKSLKITWIRRYITSCSVWKSTVDEIMGKNVKIWSMGHVALRKKIVHIKNQFWRDVFSALADFKEDFEFDVCQTSASPIFFSGSTKLKNAWIREWKFGHGMKEESGH